MHKVVLDPPPPLRELLVIAIEEERPRLAAASLDPDSTLQVILAELRPRRLEGLTLTRCYRKHIRAFMTVGKCWRSIFQ
jgi:hypothetical protein